MKGGGHAVITDEKVARINEQAALRREYVDAVKASLQGQLDHTTVIEPDGTKRKLKPKE